MTVGAGSAEDLLRRFDEALKAEALELELCVVGGAVIALAFAAEPASRRPACLFLDRRAVNAARRRAADRGRVPLDRLEDAARELSGRGRADGASAFEGQRLRVFKAPPDYVLAMRCAALTFDGGADVEGDIRYLLRYLGLGDTAEAKTVVDRYLNPRQRPPDLEERLDRLLT